MKEAARPEAYGVFKPVGHVVVGFRDAADQQSALAALRRAGFADGDIVAYTPEQMIRQADIDIEQASVLAGIGQELNLVKSHRAMAIDGQSFLVVRAPEDDRSAEVAAIAQRCHATRAQKYGHLMIEELIDPGAGGTQSPESRDTGLDDPKGARSRSR
ncbi:MAG TPA: hypothetical protein VNU71_20850 [Burkholderiaceae bacterium]|nr:hypothetical protein [Burkholderiaceae bacterium]